MDVRSEIANSVQRSYGAVRSDSHVRILQPLPGGSGGVELKPSSPEAELIRFTRSPNPVNPVGDSLQEASLDETRKGCGWHTEPFSLPPGHQPPLAFAEID